MPRVLACLLACFATGALAHEPPRAEPVQFSAPSPIPCYCRAQGRLFAPGETVCLRTPEGARLAECRMAINVITWGVTDRACPES